MITKAYHKAILFPSVSHEELIETLNAKLLNRHLTVTSVRENYYDTLMSAQSDMMKEPVHIEKFVPFHKFQQTGFDHLIIPLFSSPVSSSIDVPLDADCPSRLEIVRNFVNIRIAANTRVGRGTTHFSINIHD